MLLTRHRLTTRAATALGLVLVPILAGATMTVAATPANASEVFDTTNTGIGALLSLVTAGDLGDVAAAGGWTGAELVGTLIDDPRLFVVHDPSRPTAPGAVGYAEPLAPAVRQRAATAAAAPVARSTTVAQVMSLHSRPGSSRVIFLDFDGHTTAGTWWNDPDPAPIVSAPFDRDGNTASFSAAEIAEMEGAWRVVAEDYALFNVDVTTQDPGVTALSYDGPTDQSYGMRAVISGTDAWVGGGIGGIAWLNSFG